MPSFEWRRLVCQVEFRRPIGRWDEDVFVSRFRVGETVAGTPMPWGAYARMNDEDLRSVYRYLRSLPPVEHETGAPLQEK